MNSKIKLFSILVITLLMLTGCSNKSTSDTIINYFDKVKAGENQEINNYLIDTIKFLEKKVESTDGLSDTMDEVVSLFMSKLDIEILSEKIEKDFATINIKLTGVNIRTALTEILADKINNICYEDKDDLECLIDKIESGKLEERVGVIKLNKVNNKWIVKVDEDFKMLIIGKIEDTDIFQ